MKYFRVKEAGTPAYLIAEGLLTDALFEAKAATPNGGGVQIEQIDASLYSVGQGPWKITTAGTTYIVGAANIRAAIAKYKTAFSAIPFTKVAPCTWDLSLMFNYGEWGFVAHYGQGVAGVSNQDYSLATMDYAEAFVRQCKFTVCRVDPTLSYNSGTGVMSFTYPEGSAWYNRLKNIDGMKIMLNLSPGTPRNATGTGVNGNPTNAEFRAAYTYGYNWGRALMALCPEVAEIVMGSEMDVIEDNLKAMNGYNGSNPPPAPTGSGTDADPYVWGPKLNGATVQYPQINYGFYLAHFAGVFDGVKSKNPAVKLGYNYAGVHTGLNRRFYPDHQNIFGQTLDFVGNDWYNDAENFTDTSHAYNPADVNTGLSCTDRMNKFFIATGLTKEVKIVETGNYVQRSGKVATKADWATYVFQNYFNTSVRSQRCDEVIWFELINRTKTYGTTQPQEANLGMLNGDTLTLDPFGQRMIDLSANIFPRTMSR